MGAASLSSSQRSREGDFPEAERGLVLWKFSGDLANSIDDDLACGGE